MRRRPARTNDGFRSQFESRFNEVISHLPVDYTYEKVKVPYVLACNYNPDFVVGDYFFETKGLFKPADRRKIIAVRDQHPTKTIVLVFQDHTKRIAKNSKTTYAGWCDKNGIQWCTITTIKLKMRELGLL